MNTTVRVLIVLALAGAVALVILLKDREAATDGSGVESGLPRLVDLGAGKCVPCKLMAPILEELREDYAGRLEVTFIDVWKNPEAGQEYGIKIIPTQIFFDATGKELFRHEGFYSREDILGKWAELGVNLGAPPAAASSDDSETTDAGSP